MWAWRMAEAKDEEPDVDDAAAEDEVDDADEVAAGDEVEVEVSAAADEEVSAAEVEVLAGDEVDEVDDSEVAATVVVSGAADDDVDAATDVSAALVPASALLAALLVAATLVAASLDSLAVSDTAAAFWATAVTRGADEVDSADDTGADDAAPEPYKVVTTTTTEPVASLAALVAPASLAEAVAVATASEGCSVVSDVYVEPLSTYTAARTVAVCSWWTCSVTVVCAAGAARAAPTAVADTSAICESFIGTGGLGRGDGALRSGGGFLKEWT